MARSSLQCSLTRRLRFALFAISSLGSACRASGKPGDAPPASEANPTRQDAGSAPAAVRREVDDARRVLATLEPWRALQRLGYYYRQTDSCAGVPPQHRPTECSYADLWTREGVRVERHTCSNGSAPPCQGRSVDVFDPFDGESDRAHVEATLKDLLIPLMSPDELARAFSWVSSTKARGPKKITDRPPDGSWPFDPAASKIFGAARVSVIFDAGRALHVNIEPWPSLSPEEPWLFAQYAVGQCKLRSDADDAELLAALGGARAPEHRASVRCGEVTLESVVVHSRALPAEAIARWLKFRGPDLQDVYADALQRAPGLRGRLSLRLVFSRGGRARVTDAKFEGATGSSLAKQVARAARAWRFPFPAPTEPIEATWRLEPQGPGDAAAAPTSR